VGERALGYQAFAEFPRHAPLHVDCHKYLEVMSQAIAASEQPFHEGHERFKKLAADFAADQAALPFWEKQKYVLTTNVIPSVGATWNAAARTIADATHCSLPLPASAAGSSTANFRRQSTSRSRFLPAVPNHPADGKPLNLFKATANS
jgi:hypothetical protein